MNNRVAFFEPLYYSKNKVDFELGMGEVICPPPYLAVYSRKKKEKSNTLKINFQSERSTFSLQGERNVTN